MTKVAHQTHPCKAIVVSCIDFRLQKYIWDWAAKNIKGGFDRVAIAGGVQNLVFIVEQISLSHKLHGISEAYLINHEDCGAYGKQGSFEKHKEDLLLANTILQQKIPKLKIVPLFLKLYGKFTEIR